MASENCALATAEKTENFHGKIVGNFTNHEGRLVEVPVGEAGNAARKMARSLRAILDSMHLAVMRNELDHVANLVRDASEIASDLDALIDIVEDDAMLAGMAPVLISEIQTKGQDADQAIEIAGQATLVV